jgi:hypothetical protein
MVELYKLLEKQDANATAIVGMTKNVGKTVTLNYLIRKFELSGVITGLVSAGYDGESFDRLNLKSKPRIYAPKNSFVATAKACFEAAEADLEMIEQSSYSTPLGPVYLGKVRRAGNIELAGPASASGLKALLNAMLVLGAEHVLVDGAINRLASASPRVTGGTILTTGAALGSVMEEVVDKTVFRRELLKLPGIDDDSLLQAARKGLESGNAVLLHRGKDDYQVESIRAVIPLLACAELIDKCRRDTAALVFGGALVDGSLSDIMDLYPEPPVVIVIDATRVFISPEIFYRFLSRGGKILVLNEINLIAATLNPTDPGGQGFDPAVFLQKMTEALSPCPVFDLILESNSK